MKTYKELIVWQKSYKLTFNIYNISKKFPREELYGLSSQMRRCSLAIPSNIAEGFTRQHTKEYVQFLYVAFSSGAELETQLQLALDLHYISKNNHFELQSLLDEVMKMLNVLIGKLKLVISR